MSFFISKAQSRAQIEPILGILESALGALPSGGAANQNGKVCAITMVKKYNLLLAHLKAHLELHQMATFLKALLQNQV